MSTSVQSWWCFQHLHRILMVAGALLVALVVAVSVGGSMWLHNRALRDAETRLAQLTLVIAEQVERSLESADGVVQATLNRMASADLDDPETRSRIFAFLSQQSINLPQSRSFVVVDDKGNRVIDSQNAVPPPLDFSKGDGFRYFQDNPTDDRVYISSPAKSRTTGEWYFSLARRLPASDSMFGGMLTASIDISYFTDFFKAALISDHSSIALVRLDGIHLLRYPIVESAYGRSLADAAIHKDYLPHTKAGVIREVSPLTGTERILSFRALKQYPVVVVIGSSIDETLAPWRLQVWGIAIFGIGTVLGLTIFGVMLVRLARREELLLSEAEAARNAAELATNAAERASRAKSEFLAGVSHDLRTPLNSIIGFSEVMLDGLSGPLTTKAQEYLGFIHMAGKHLLSLINNLLDIAKIEANRLTIVDDRFSLKGVVGECLRLVEPQAKAGRVTLAPYGSSEFGLRADPVRVRQILFNLVSNAIKFTRPGGTVDVRAHREPDGGLRISVVDTGVGMTQAELDTALQAYGQVMNAYVREREGTGLGLPLVKALIELHGGQFEITSAPKQGTTATVIFPADRVLSDEETGTRAA